MPAGPPHLSHGCFQTRGLGGGGQRAQVGGQSPRYVRQKTGMGHLEQQTDWARHGWVGHGGRNHAMHTHKHGTSDIKSRLNFRQSLNRGIIHRENFLLKNE
jgi:hypothetical protein